MAEQLQSDRLRLRKLAPDDAVHFARLLEHDSESVQMMATMPDPCTAEAARGWIEQRLGAGARLFAILRAEDGEFLGAIGFGGPPEALELGYWIGRPHWGRGYVTEAVQTIIEFARACGVRKMLADTWPYNPASERVLEKTGFRKIGSAMVDTPLRGGLRRVNQFEIDLGQNQK
jgi:RimJ/RimL family protein N-acetyltransferase